MKRMRQKKRAKAKTTREDKLSARTAEMTDRPKKKREGTVCEVSTGCVRTWMLCFFCAFTHSYQFPRQEDVLLPRHHHTHTLSLPGAAQHGHEFLLATACHVYSVHLHTHTTEEKTHTHQSRLKRSVLSTGSAPLTRILLHLYQIGRRRFCVLRVISPNKNIFSNIFLMIVLILFVNVLRYILRDIVFSISASTTTFIRTILW